MKGHPAPFRRSPFSAPARFGRRDLILTLTCLALIYLLYTKQWDTSPHFKTKKPAESVRLQRYMNANREQIPLTPSSFNWSTVSYAYPPPPNIPLPKGRANLPRIQATFPPETPEQFEIREARRREVRLLFQKNWASYRKHAWMRDALLPVSGQGRDQFSGWAATLVDSLDTLWMMGLRDEFEEAVAAVAQIDFGQSTNPRVNMFETNIRYLGGLLGAYDLSGQKVLLAKAVELGDMLFAGFNTEHRMPVDFFSIEDSKRGEGLIVEGQVVNAAAGTLTMEFTRLSQVTGDPKYYTAITNMISVFEKGQRETLLPGLWPTIVSMSRMDVVSGRGFALGSGADSTYEYITKMYPLLGGNEKRYQKMSIDWMDAADKAMFYRPMLPDEKDILFAGNLDFYGDDSSNLDPESEHLACFLGGTYALGGKLFDREDYLTIGAKLGLGCAYAYNVTATGMMCERFNMVKCDSREQCPWDKEKWEVEKTAKGLWREGVPLGFTSCKDPRYILRPEAIESIFYLWRITGQAQYQQIAWEMFAAVGNGTLTEFANAAVKDVTSTAKPLAKEDYMESFWLAETLKYFYLALSPPDLISLDEFVLNTEAHPFRMPN
ncbi:hypothetical protein N0V82_003297 [Gnomoniopsis sp. IMI 355080]|nr:hypothetical protein N0V82_003297 [Gnomoniopsis sp. IMI 355080]